MGQLRETIRTMVRNEFASRMIEEAKKGKYDGKTVYRASKYVDLWNGIPKGKPTTEITETPTKFDFVRRFMKELQASTNSASKLYLDPEYREEAMQLLTPLLNDPDEFIETLNKERGLFFGIMMTDNPGGNLRSSPDPVLAYLQQYLSDKDVRQSLGSVEGDRAPEDDAAKAEGEEGEYDIIPGTHSKADIARNLESDPTETTTEMSVGNRLKKAMVHLTKERNLEILEFIKDASVDKADKANVMKNLETITRMAKKGVEAYTTLFVDSMIGAMKPVKNVEDDAEIDKAVKAGYKKFVAALRSAGTFSPGVNKDQINPNEFNVFAAALDASEGRWSVLDMMLIAAKKPEKAETFRDEAIAASKEVFEHEMETQTNFNSLGDYTDAMPEMKKVREELFQTLSKRGRKKGTTKEVIAQRKAAAAPAKRPMPTQKNKK